MKRVGYFVSLSLVFSGYAGLISSDEAYSQALVNRVYLSMIGVFIGAAIFVWTFTRP